MEFCKSQLSSQFSLEGRFLGFAAEPGGKLKYLRIAVETDEVRVKLPKESRRTLYQNLIPGDAIQVFGTQKFKAEELRLKAYQVNKIAAVNAGLATLPSPDPLPCQKKAKIRVCEGSGCRKRGGRKLLDRIEAVLSELGLEDQVAIERTGCVKRCSAAPNVVLPGKNRCGKLHPDAISSLLQKHFIVPPHSNCPELPCEQN